MKPELQRRRLRMRLAPPGSQRDGAVRWFFERVGAVRRDGMRQAARQLLPINVRRDLRMLRRRWKLRDTQYRQQLEELRSQLRSILAAHPEAPITLIFPPSLDWNIQLFQRPQQLALAFAQQGALVFYLLRTPPAQGLPFETVQERLYLCRTPEAVFDIINHPILYLLTWNLDWAEQFNDPRVVYDYVDEIETFAGASRSMRRQHEHMLRQAQHVLVTALLLQEQVAPVRPDALLCPNAVDVSVFRQAANTPAAPPKDFQPVLAHGQPVIGYYGALARWFDYELLAGVARRRPDCEFVLIGPDYDSTLPPALLDLPNLTWLGVKPYAELPHYLQFFDVAMIPFRLNAITHATSPLKLFEYMAGGKPVVITPMQESLRYAGVLAARDVAEFSQQIDRALVLRHDPAYQALLAQVAQENTWEQRARLILSVL